MSDKEKLKDIKIRNENSYCTKDDVDFLLNLIDKTIKECKFIQCEDDMDNNYMCTNCGEVWCFEENTPVEVDCNYCSKCGAKITEVIKPLKEEE